MVRSDVHAVVLIAEFGCHIEVGVRSVVVGMAFS